MNTYYLRIEGVNLDNFVYDTNDLQTIRGGGLLLLGAVEKILDSPALKGLPGLRSITRGASWGLVRFEASSDTAADEISGEVKAFLKTEPYRHATFVVDLVRCRPGFYVQDRDMSTALNRWRQMQSPSLAVPAASGENTEIRGWPDFGICQIDRIRPAHDEGPVKKKVKWLSGSVLARRKEGNESKKRAWYERQVRHADPPLPEFVNDLGELAGDPDRDYGNLANKMAVIYLDGNHFGKRQRTYCTDEEKQKYFDDTLREKYQRQGALGGLLREIVKDRHWFTKQDLENGKIRLETLLWGGDEIIWVVPAWKGWWTLGKFFKLSEGWDIDRHPLTHGAGLVFCHHKAHIHRIKEVAVELAEIAKNKSRKENLVAYQVFESYDHAGGDLEAMRKRRLPPCVTEADLVVSGVAMLDAVKTITAIKNTLPKRRLYRFVQSFWGDSDKADAQIKELETDCGITQTEIENLTTCLGGPPGCWLHLLELWDYITDLKKENDHDSN